MAQAYIQSVSLWDIIRIHFLSIIFGSWILSKKILKSLWRAGRQSEKIKSSGQLRRDTPPACLVDSRLGTHKYVKLKGVKLHYVEAGEKGQPLIVLLHGFPDFWLSWRYQIPILADHFHVVVPDLKGFGDSDKPLWRYAYKIETVLEELEQFIHSVGAKECIIVGHDLGALLGWYLVHKSPSLVTKFFAVSSPHPNVHWKSINSRYSYKWLNFVQLPYLPEIDAMNEDAKIINQYHNHLKHDDEQLEAYKYTFSRKEDWTGPINYYRNLPFLKIKEGIDEISVPTILITGNKDQFVELEAIVASTEFCDKFHLKIIEGAGHFPQQENPKMFNATLLKYLLRDKPTESSKYTLTRSPSKRLIEGLFGAVSNTVKYGNSVIGSVQKSASDVVSNIPTLSLNFNNNYCKEGIQTT